MMTATETTQIVQRYQRLLDALDPGAWTQTERRWQRLGAVAALQCLCAPGTAAERMLGCAEALASAGGIDLRSGLRFQIAGALAQAGMEVEDVLVQMRRVRELLRAAGVRGSHGHEAATIAIVLLRSSKPRLRVHDVGQVVALYRHLRLRHSWQREVAEAPLAALLVQHQLGSAVVGQRLASVHERLSAITGVVGAALTVPVGILAAQRDGDEAVTRFERLFRASGSDPRPGLLATLALWAEIDGDPLEVLEAGERVGNSALQRWDSQDPSAEFACGALAYLTMSEAACGTAEGLEDPMRNPLRSFHASCAFAGLELIQT